MAHIYLSGWEQYDDGAPGVAFRPLAHAGGWRGGLRDLRPDPTRVTGWCLLVKDTPLDPVPAGVHLLGETWDDVPPRAISRAIETRLGLPQDLLVGVNLRTIVRRLTLEIESNANFALRALPTKSGHTRIHIGGEAVYEARTHDPRSASIEITESFPNNGNLATVDGDLDWVNVVGGADEFTVSSGVVTAVLENNSLYLGVNSVLDTDDTECEVTFTTFARGSGFVQTGPMVRMPAPAAHIVYAGTSRRSAQATAPSSIVERQAAASTRSMARSTPIRRNCSWIT